jgi:hypothetical protein
MFDRHDEKLIVFAFMAVFVSYCPLFWGYGGDLHGLWHLVHVWEAWPKTCHFYIFGPFSWAIVHSFGFSGWFSSPWHLVLVWYAWPKTCRFCVYGCTWPMTVSTCLRGMTKNSPFLHFGVIFMSYCPLFWVFEVIYKAHDMKGICPRGNNKVVIIIFHVYDKCLFLMLELY